MTPAQPSLSSIASAKEGLNNSPAKLLPRGTLLMALYGQGKTRGKVGILGIEAATNQACAAISLNSSVVPEFIFLFLSSQYDTIRKLSNIGNQENLNGALVRSIPVGLPPPPEQRAIATALSDVDGLLGGLDRLIAKKRDLKQAAMQQLLTGQTRLPGFHGEWKVRKLGNVTDTDPENLASNTHPDFSFNYSSLEDVDRGTLKSHSEQVFRTAPSRARRRLRNEDVLVSTVRPNLKSHLLFRDNGQHWIGSTGFCVVRCRERLTHPGYIFFHMFGHLVARQIDSLLTGSNYPAINSVDVRALEIPFPDYDEQTAIAEVLTDMDAELSALEQRREKTRALKQAMMQECLTGRTRLVTRGDAKHTEVKP